MPSLSGCLHPDQWASWTYCPSSGFFDNCRKNPRTTTSAPDHHSIQSNSHTPSLRIVKSNSKCRKTYRDPCRWQTCWSDFRRLGTFATSLPVEQLLPTPRKSKKSTWYRESNIPRKTRCLKVNMAEWGTSGSWRCRDCGRKCRKRAFWSGKSRRWALCMLSAESSYMNCTTRCNYRADLCTDTQTLTDIPPASCMICLSNFCCAAPSSRGAKSTPHAACRRKIWKYSWRDISRRLAANQTHADSEFNFDSHDLKNKKNCSLNHDWRVHTIRSDSHLSFHSKICIGLLRSTSNKRHSNKLQTCRYMTMGADGATKYLLWNSDAYVARAI